MDVVSILGGSLPNVRPKGAMVPLLEDAFIFRITCIEIIPILIFVQNFYLLEIDHRKCKIRANRHSRVRPEVALVCGCI
jgi:hypothetical protein